MGVSEGLIQEIVRRVLRVAAAERIILFGSAAAGTMTRDSDIDLLVIEDAPPKGIDESVNIRRSIGDLGFPFDVIVISRERFEETKNLIGGIAYPANKYGKVIYEEA